MSRPSTSRPVTPIRRISRGSVSALAFSQTSTQQDPLAHLAPLLGELADSAEILSDNFARLNAINDDLDDFNEAFAGYLFGLKMNAYASDFTEAPTKLSFELLQKRKQAAAARFHAPPGLDEAATDQASESGSDAPDATIHAAETTFHSVAEQSHASNSASRIARGRGRGGTRGGRAAQVARKRERMAAFCASIIETLEIAYREQQPHRSEAEQVIAILREHPEGLHLPDIVDKTSPPVAKHRVNAVLNALLRSKHAIKVANKGLVYRLDPVRHPPAVGNK